MAVVTPVRPLSKEEIQDRLTEIVAELDDIGPTFGMAGRRKELQNERDRLLDRLIELRKEG